MLEPTPPAYPDGVAADPYAYRYAPPPAGRFQSFVVRTAARLPAWAAPAGVAVCIGGAVAYTLLMDPTRADASTQSTCVMRLFTGFDCPGCGGTRAAWYLMHGDVPAAARHHAPLVFATPFLIYMYLAWTVKAVSRRSWLPQLPISSKALVGFLAAWAVFSVARNLPWDPFTWLWV